MTRPQAIFGGVFAAFALCWFGLVVVPQNQLGGMQPEVDSDSGAVYPPVPSGLAARGREIYAANGCGYCHTQVVRGETGGADIARGWGKRRTVARDFLYEEPLVLGSLRVGPDLANVGSGELADPFAGEPNGARRKDATWHFVHLYSPRMLRKDSLMPSYRFLFERRRISGDPAPDALPLTGGAAPPAGYEVVPTPEAKALVSYLLSLDRGQDVKEAKVSPLARLTTGEKTAP
jgi:cytochrome c oxidase cbb3-type subunit II